MFSPLGNIFDLAEFSKTLPNSNKKIISMQTSFRRGIDSNASELHIRYEPLHIYGSAAIPQHTPRAVISGECIFLYIESLVAKVVVVYELTTRRVRWRRRIIMHYFHVMCFSYRLEMIFCEFSVIKLILMPFLLRYQRAFLTLTIEEKLSWFILVLRLRSWYHCWMKTAV